MQGGGLTWARASTQTPHGQAAVHWRREADHLTVDLTVPAEAEGVFTVPAGWRAAEPLPLALPAGDHQLVMRRAVPR